MHNKVTVIELIGYNAAFVDFYLLLLWVFCFIMASFLQLLELLIVSDVTVSISFSKPR